jgi:tetratricopeptide (TPR) repeat protein
MLDDLHLAGLLADGLGLHRAGRLAAARACYRAVLADMPDNADALHLLGLVAHGTGGHEEAIGYLSRAVALRPDVAHFRANLGTARLASGDDAGAEACFRAVLERQPGNDDAWNNLGLALLRQERNTEAEPCFATAHALAPGRTDAGANLVACLHRIAAAAAAHGQPDAAEAAYRAALAVQPDNAPCLTNLGNLLVAGGRPGEAEALLRRVALLRPDAADAQHNLAACLAAAGRLAEAEAASLACLRLDPDHADAAYLLGTVRLLGGQWPEGFAGLEQRWRRRGFASPHAIAQPQWQGEALDGRTLLLHAEQGLGDAIQMLRFVPALAARGAVLLEVPASLRRLADRFAPAVTVLTAGAARPAFDLHCPLPSLPFALKLGLADIPAGVPYLHPDAADAAVWRARLADVPGLRVGLAWAGNPAYAADSRRSIRPDRLAVLADLPGVAFVSLQRDASAPIALHDRTGDLRDLADTAALIAALDLVVSVDTAVAHLAGALGKQVWLLNRFDTCWRWLRARTDSPWYPTLRQYRQARPGEWDGVLAAVRDDLAARARGLAV